MPKFLVLANYNADGIKGILDKGGSSRHRVGVRARLSLHPPLR